MVATMEGAHAVVAVLGAVIVIYVWSSVIRTLVVPRGLRSALTGVAQKGTIGLFSLIGGRVRSFEARDRILAWAAPLSILVTLVFWIVGFVLGYSLLLAGVSDESVGTDVREGASALLALTFLGKSRASLTIVDLFAAATGPVVIGLLVGYLPTLYASYSRRETDVTMLEARAGEPNWGPEILARHASIDSLDALDGFFRDWERWAADISESHTNYPVLVHVRSARPLRNWLVGMVSVMDAAALNLALAPSSAPSSARMAVRAGFVCLRDIATTVNIDFDADPDPDGEIQLTYDEFLRAVARLESTGFPMERTAQEAWPHFRGWRVNYEAIAYVLADRIDAVAAPWTGPRRRGDAPIPPRTPRNRLPGGGHGPVGSDRPVDPQPER